MMKKQAVIIFVKYPEPGKVKTRLASKTNEAFALKFYNAIAQIIFEEIEQLGNDVDKYIYFSPLPDIELLKKWVKRDFFYVEQRGTNLGQKISNALKELFDKGYGKVIIMGSDVPDISKEVIQRSLILLDEKNVVIAPADDGGYSLLGIDAFYPMLFENIEWSTEKVFETTRSIIAENNLSLEVIEKLNDIDTRNELENWLRVADDSKLALKIKSIAREENIKL